MGQVALCMIGRHDVCILETGSLQSVVHTYVRTYVCTHVCNTNHRFSSHSTVLMRTYIETSMLRAAGLCKLVVHMHLVHTQAKSVQTTSDILIQQLCRHEPPSVKSVHQPTSQISRPSLMTVTDGGSSWVVVQFLHMHVHTYLLFPTAAVLVLPLYHSELLTSVTILPLCWFLSQEWSSGCQGHL